METKPKLLISYSRRQTPFVDRLADKLEDHHYEIWLDYQSLVPAVPWEKQIEAGVDKADVILLVVSRESIASENVKPEWQRAHKCGKPIILVLFEAVSLADVKELEQYDWVDFRTDFKKPLIELEKKIDEAAKKPISERKPADPPVPQSGFKAPKRFWLSLILSVLVVIASIPTWWTLFLPYILIPLPKRIFTRDYIYSRVIPALFLLPIISVLTDVMFLTNKDSVFYFLHDFAEAWLPLLWLASWALAGLLMTPAMQRRAMPEAARFRFADRLNKKDLESVKAESRSFLIDHAPEDERYAKDLKRGLENAKHYPSTNDQTADARFVLISSYKKSTIYNPDTQAVYPIVLQAVNDLDEKLSRIQWIDFREGIRNIHTLAKLLDEPQKMLKALAVPPTGKQEIFPFAVSALQYFFLLTGILGGGGLLASIIPLIVLFIQGSLPASEIVKLLLLTLNGLLLLGSVTIAVKALRTRTGGASALYPLLVLTVFQLIVHLLNFFIFISSDPTAGFYNRLITAASGTGVSAFAFPLGLILILPGSIFRWKDLYRWLPRRQGTSVSQVESILLLYTPTRRRALVFHAIFHFLLLTLFLFLNFFITEREITAAIISTLVIGLMAVGIRSLARRVSL